MINGETLSPGILRSLHKRTELKSTEDPLIKLFLIKLLDGKVGKFLDIGSGPTPQTYWPSLNNVVFVDKTKDLLPKIGEGYAIDIEKEPLPFKDSSYELVLACRLINNISKSANRTIAEIARVTKKDGQIIIIFREAVTKTFTVDQLKQIMMRYGIEEVYEEILIDYGQPSSKNSTKLIALTGKKVKEVESHKRRRKK